MEILPVNIQNTGGAAVTSRSAAVTSNFIYKIREIFITTMTNTLEANSFAALEQIINNAWIAKLNTQPALKSTLQSNTFSVSVTGVSRYLTNKNNFVFKVEYIVSIANRDPEYLGISEPTNNQYQAAFTSSGTQLCNCYGVENIRIYFNSLTTNDANTQTIINNIIMSLWNQQNPLNPVSSRLNYTLSVNSGFYTSTGSQITRLNLAWVMDSDTPSPIFFNVPTAYNVTQTLKSVNIVPYTSIPCQKYTIYLTNFVNSNVDLIPTLVSQAWSSSNTNYVPSDFVVNVITQSSTKSRFV